MAQNIYTHTHTHKKNCSVYKVFVGQYICHLLNWQNKLNTMIRLNKPISFIIYNWKFKNRQKKIFYAQSKNDYSSSFHSFIYLSMQKIKQKKLSSLTIFFLIFIFLFYFFDSRDPCCLWYWNVILPEVRVNYKNWLDKNILRK